MPKSIPITMMRYINISVLAKRLYFIQKVKSPFSLLIIYGETLKLKITE